MLDMMMAIGAQIQEKMNWIPITQPIHKKVSNAGGHGTREARYQQRR
jgi:hypothetical protein